MVGSSKGSQTSECTNSSMKEDLIVIFKMKYFMDCFPTNKTFTEFVMHHKNWYTCYHILHDQLIEQPKIQMDKLQMPQPIILVVDNIF